MTRAEGPKLNPKEQYKQALSEFDTVLSRYQRRRRTTTKAHDVALALNKINSTGKAYAELPAITGCEKVLLFAQSAQEIARDKRDKDGEILFSYHVTDYRDQLGIAQEVARQTGKSPSFAEVKSEWIRRWMKKPAEQ